MTKKHIFITGAASGIGRATAHRFAEEGWFILAADKNQKGLEQLHRSLKSDACAIYDLDVTDKEAFDLVMQAVDSQTNGKLDIMFNNAGIGITGFFEDIPYEETRRMIDVNVVGVVNGIYAAIPLLKATPNSLCFSTSSSAATYGAPSLAVYAATKYAVKGLTEALAVELNRFGIRVADMLPGLIDTPILYAKRYIDGKLQDDKNRTVGVNLPSDGPFRLIDPSEVAEVVWRAYEDNRVHWYVPPEIEDIDRAKTLDVEGERDQRIQQENPLINSWV